MCQGHRQVWFAPRRFVKPRAAFTLVELLVVMSIIAVLISLVFPTFGTVKEQGNVVLCTNHLQQLFRAVSAYAQDNDGRFPNNEGGASGIPKSWISGYSLTGSNGVETITQGLLYPYVNDIRVYRCPSFPSKEFVRSYSMADYLSGKRAPTRYRNNNAISYRGDTRPRAETFAAVERPALTLMITEENPAGFPPRDGRVYINDGFFMRSTADRPATYHRVNPANPWDGKCNVLFVDGHIELLSTRLADMAYQAYYRMPEVETTSRMR